jgi:hypothetical protein
MAAGYSLKKTARKTLKKLLKNQKNLDKKPLKIIK